MPGTPQHLSNQLAEQILVDSFEGESFLDEEDLKYLSDLDPNASFTDILNEYHKTDINNRLVELYISEILQRILDIDEDRVKNKKDLTIETPFLNFKGERIKSYILLPVFIDSLTELESKAEKKL